MPVEQENMLIKICQFRFAALETALYLDTHPNDTRILDRHNYFCEELDSLLNDYELKYNDPLTIYDKSQDYWRYLDRFPFGNKCSCKEVKQ